MPRPFPVEAVRDQFPALTEVEATTFFDNAAGSQLPAVVIEAIRRHLVHHMVQRGGPYTQSRQVDAVILEARRAVADLVNAPDPEEVAFGLNATSFMRLVSQAIAEQGGERNEIVVSDLDHEANVSVWLDLERRGFSIRRWPLAGDAPELAVDQLRPLLSERTRLVAVTWASNAVGSVVDVAGAADAAHRVGAELFVDAVHYLPHGPIDVQGAQIDYLACSAYKAFAPHIGFLWGRRRLLDALPAFREYFIPDRTPHKFELGTYAYENVAGLLAAVGYLESLGRSCGAQGDRRRVLGYAMTAIRDYEASLSERMLQGLARLRSIRVYGAPVPQGRTPTFSFTAEGITPTGVCRELAQRGYSLRHGHLYCPRLMERLGLSSETGAVRASLVHYNTLGEVDGFVAALGSLSGSDR